LLSYVCACSPEEAYEAFQTHRVTEAQFAEQGPLLVGKPGLMCRLGDRLYPWHEAAPVVMGVLAFGGAWQHFLPVEGGVPVVVPSVEAEGTQEDARKVSGLVREESFCGTMQLGSAECRQVVAQVRSQSGLPVCTALPYACVCGSMHMRLCPRRR